VHQVSARPCAVIGAFRNTVENSVENSANVHLLRAIDDTDDSLQCRIGNHMIY
jgi:hypothetical protein